MNIQDRINRLIEMHVIQKSTGDFLGDEFYAEFRLHQKAVVQKYLPLLNDLALAGVLTAWIDDLGEEREIESVCENGGFQLNAERVTVDITSPRPYENN